MAGIGAKLFYKKRLIPCVPSNNQESEGSSESDNDCEATKNTKKKVKKGCVVAISEENEQCDSSDASEQRWGCKDVEPSDIVIPPSDHSSDLYGSVSTSGPSSRGKTFRKKVLSRKPRLILSDRYNAKSCLPSPDESGRKKDAVKVPTQVPRNPCRKLVFPNASRVTTVLHSSNNASGPSKRAHQILEASSPRKPLSNKSSNVNLSSPQKILAQIKRHQGLSCNKENIKDLQDQQQDILGVLLYQDKESLPVNEKNVIVETLPEADTIDDVDTNSVSSTCNNLNQAKLPCQTVSTPYIRDKRIVTSNTKQSDLGSLGKTAEPRITPTTKSKDSTQNMIPPLVQPRVSTRHTSKSTAVASTPKAPSSKSTGRSTDDRTQVALSSPNTPTACKVPSPGLSPITPGTPLAFQSLENVTVVQGQQHGLLEEFLNQDAATILDNNPNDTVETLPEANIIDDIDSNTLSSTRNNLNQAKLPCKTASTSNIRNKRIVQSRPQTKQSELGSLRKTAEPRITPSTKSKDSTQNMIPPVVQPRVSTRPTRKCTAVASTPKAPSSKSTGRSTEAQGERTEAPPEIDNDINQNSPTDSASDFNDLDDSEEGEGWREGDLQEIIFNEEPQFTVPDALKKPEEYFQFYFDTELVSLITEQTNIYTTQKSGKSICVTPEEILAFFGIMIYMGVCSLPAARDYWDNQTNIPQVSSVMSRDRYKLIHSNIHFHNNEEGGDDKLLKIRPLLNHMRAKCQSVEQECELSVDERMEGYKGTRAGSLRQFMPDKPSSRFGFKLFVLAAKSGMTHDFIPYTGQDTFAAENLTNEEKQMGVGAMAVIALCKSVTNPKRTTVTFDNYYTGIPLVTFLRDKMELHSVGTIKRIRTQQCPLTDVKKFQEQGRGTCESRVNKNAIVVVQWADNKPVCLASSFVGVNPAGTIKRYSKEAHRKIDVPCPRAVAVYNQTMGGVDLSDMYMALYKIPTRAKRYYFPFIGYSLELALTNSWLQYKRDCQLLQIPTKDMIPNSKKFRLLVSEGLRALCLRSLGQPSMDNSLTKKKIRRPVVCRPNDTLRTDGYGHLPETCNKGRCRYCCNGTSRIKCTKCETVLCLNKDRNCFVQFHITAKGRLVPKDREEEEETGENDEEENVDDDLMEFQL